MAFDQLKRKIAKADPAGGGAKLRDGKGVLVVDRIVAKEGFKGTSVRIEAVVESSSRLTVVSPSSKQTLDIAPNDPGSSVSIVENLKNSGAEGRILAALLAIFGYDNGASDEVKAEVLDAIQEEGDHTQNLAYGLAVAYETERFVTKNGIEMAGPRFTALKQTDEDIKRRQAMLKARRGE